MIENKELQMDNKTLVTILNWAEEATPLRVLSKEQRQKEIDLGIYNPPQPKNVLQRMAYLYSKEAEQTFFLNPGLNELFLFFYQVIRNTPYETREKEQSKIIKA